MSEEWLEVDDNLLVAHIDEGADTFPCVWDGEPVGETAIVIVPSESKNRYALLALRNVDVMQDALSRIEDVSVGTTLAASDYVRLEENASERPCVMCDEVIRAGAPQLGMDVLISRPQYVPTSAVAVHKDCIEDFNKALDNVWDETDVLLSRAFDDNE